MILFEPPARPHDEIGVVSSLGGAFASEGDMLRKMQMAGAQLGADAVVVRGGAGATVRSGSGVTVVQSQQVNTSWDFPKTSAVAIRWR